MSININSLVQDLQKAGAFDDSLRTAKSIPPKSSEQLTVSTPIEIEFSKEVIPPVQNVPSFTEDTASDSLEELSEDSYELISEEKEIPTNSVQHTDLSAVKDMLNKIYLSIERLRDEISIGANRSMVQSGSKISPDIMKKYVKLGDEVDTIYNSLTEQNYNHLIDDNFDRSRMNTYVRDETPRREFSPVTVIASRGNPITIGKTSGPPPIPTKVLPPNSHSISGNNGSAFDFWPSLR